jgi:cytochrome c-type biogenesis protein
MDFFLLLWLSFLAGFLAPISSPCILVMYPGYIAFLARRSQDGTGTQIRPALIGITISCGILVSLLAGGIVFSLLVMSAGGAVRAIVTPVIYVILLVLSLSLIFGTGSGRTVSLPLPLLPADPLAAAFLYGALFGIIILPCNAAALVLLFALAATAGGFSDGLGSFLLYGAGVIAPLLILSFLSQARSHAFLDILSRHQRAIRITAGIFMLAIALWYLALLAVPVLPV